MVPGGRDGRTGPGLATPPKRHVLTLPIEGQPRRMIRQTSGAIVASPVPGGEEETLIVALTVQGKRPARGWPCARRAHERRDTHAAMAYGPPGSFASSGPRRSPPCDGAGRGPSADFRGAAGSRLSGGSGGSGRDALGIVVAGAVDSQADGVRRQQVVRGGAERDLAECEPCAERLRGENDRHAAVDRAHGGVRSRGEDGEGARFTPSPGLPLMGRGTTRAACRPCRSTLASP